MKAGNEIKKGWAVVICPKCGTGWGMDPRIHTTWNFTGGCDACRPKKLSNTEFCKAVRNRLDGMGAWVLLSAPQTTRDTYVAGKLTESLARLEKAEKKISTMIEAPSYFPAHQIYAPATVPDMSASISIKRCSHCRGRGFVAKEYCSHCHGAGYVVVNKEKPKAATRDSVHAYCPCCMRPFDASIYKCCPDCGNELVEGKRKP